MFSQRDIEHSFEGNQTASHKPGTTRKHPAPTGAPARRPAGLRRAPHGGLTLPEPARHRATQSLTEPTPA